jgi:outer membrane cobalamin receptor
MNCLWNNFFKRLTALLPLVVCVWSVAAIEPQVYSLADSTAVHPIEKVTVRASRHTEIIPAQVLNGGELQKLSSYSVADALRYFSGVQLKDYGGVGGLKTVNIRSLGSHHVGVFIDGAEVGNAQNGVVDLGRFSLDNIESVSIYNGQRSAIFQPARDFASSAALYIETRRPQFTEERNYNLKATLRGGSFKTVNPSLLWERRLGERTSLSLNAEYLYTSGEYRYRYAKQGGYDTTAVRKNGDVRMLRTEAALFGSIAGGEWRAKAYFYNSERGYPGAVVREVPGALRHRGRQWDTNFFTQGQFRKSFAPHYSLMLSGKYSYDFLHYIGDPSSVPTDNRFHQQQAYMSAANLFTIFPWWSANLSVDGEWSKLNADLNDFAFPRRVTLLGAAATSVNFRRFSAQASLLYTHVGDRVERASQPADRNHLTPTVMLSYKPFSDTDLTLRGFYKKIFRMPTFNDLYYTTVGSGNANLAPEYTTQYNIGLAYSKVWGGSREWQIDTQIDAYYNEVKNKIVAVPSDNQFRWMMINLGYVEIRGVDAAIGGSRQWGDWRVSARATYTYQRAQDMTDPASPFYGDQIPYIPWHSGSLSSSVGWREWELNYSFIYTGERYEQAANTPENYSPPWYTSDVALARLFRLPASVVRASVEVNNLFNQPYEVVQCYPMPGTNFKITLSITL